MNGKALQEPIRRLRRVGLALVLLASGGVAWCFGAPRPDSPVALVAAMDLQQTVTGWASATDRRGGHLAVATSDGRLHFLTLSGDCLDDHALPASAALRGDEPVMLQFSDRDGDDLVELVAIGPRGQRGYESLRACPPGMVFGTADGLVASEGSLRLCQVSVRDTDATWRGGGLPEQAVVGARPYVFTRSAARDGACRVVPADGHGRRQNLAGLPVAVGDLNGCGGDEILTAEQRRDEPEGATYRLYAADRRGFREVWSYHVEHPAFYDIGFRPESFLATIRDLDGDGVAELALADWATGRVAVWRWTGDMLD